MSSQSRHAPGKGHKQGQGQKQVEPSQASTLVDKLEEHWSTSWKGWFDQLRKEHSDLLKTVETLKALDDEYIQAVNVAKGSETASAPTAGSRFVRVNFGGQKCLTLQRDHLLGSHVEFNFFCALFDPRWQAVLPKDSEGRIYLDLNYEWVKPVLDEITNKTFAASCGEDSVIPPSYSAGRSLISFCPPWSLEKLMALPFAAEGVIRCDNTTISNWDKTTKERFRAKIFNFLGKADDNCDLNLAKIAWPNPASTNTRLLVITADDRSIVGLLLDGTTKCKLFAISMPAIPSCDHLDIAFTSEQYNIDFSAKNNVRINWNAYGPYNSHPQFTVGNGYVTFPSTWNSSSQRRFSEILSFEISCSHSNFNMFGKNQGEKGSVLRFADPLTISGSFELPQANSSNRSSTMHQSLSLFMNSLCDTEKEIASQQTKFTDFLKFKLTEARFIENIVLLHGWAGFVRPVGSPSCFKPMHELEFLSQYTKGELSNHAYIERIRESYGRIAKNASILDQARETANIVTFNVSGESVSVLRSSIFAAVPGSQLAIRVSDEWVEQESTMDEEGRLIVDFPIDIFLSLIDYIRAVGLFGADYVPKQVRLKLGNHEAAARSMLQYLSINDLQIVKP